MKNLILIFVLFINMIGCEKQLRVESVSEEKLLKSGKLIFEDDFSKDLKNWQAESSNWKIVEGQLYTGDRPNENKGLWLNNVSLPTNVRIEFDSTSIKGNLSAFPGDTKFEFGGKDYVHASGYIILFGGWSNQTNAIARGDEHKQGQLIVDSEKKVEEDKKYHWTVIKYNNQISWYLDGKLFLSVKDDSPSDGGDFGFNNWNSRVYFDNLKIFAL